MLTGSRETPRIRKENPGEQPCDENLERSTHSPACISYIFQKPSLTWRTPSARNKHLCKDGWPKAGCPSTGCVGGVSKEGCDWLQGANWSDPAFTKKQKPDGHVASRSTVQRSFHPLTKLALQLLAVPHFRNLTCHIAGYLAPSIRWSHAFGQIAVGQRLAFIRSGL